MRPLILLVSLIAALAACGGQSLSSSGSGSGPGDGYYYVTEEQPHPGIAEGKPVVEVDGRTFYACPPMAVGEVTPLIEDACLMPGDAGASKYGAYSMIEESKPCADGRKVTDVGSLGWGFVGSPLIGQTQAAPDREAVLACVDGRDGGVTSSG